MPKTIWINPHVFCLKILNKWEFPQLVLNYWSAIEFKDFIKACEDYTEETISFLVKDMTLLSDILLPFMKSLFQNNCYCENQTVWK